MNKSKQSKSSHTLRVIAPYPLEECVMRLDELRHSRRRHLKIHITKIDDDLTGFNLIQYRSASLVGYLKRWDQSSTLIVARSRLLYVWYLLPAAGIVIGSLVYTFAPSDAVAAPAFIAALLGVLSLPFIYRWLNHHSQFLLTLTRQTFGEDNFEQSAIEIEMGQRSTRLAHHLLLFMSKIRSR